MKVHHLNCGTMRPPLVPEHVCHVLLVETDAGLVLIDAGIGLEDIDNPGRRLGPIRHLIRPALRTEEAAYHRVRQLGFSPSDVRHIIATHLDLDHLGGVADFPDATLHTTAAEADSVYSNRVYSRVRYRRPQLQPPPKIVKHEAQGDSWRGFGDVSPLSEIADGIVMIPMPGHTNGHCAVAVEADSRWVLHCGDAFFDRRTLRTDDRAPAPLRLFERAVAQDWKKVTINQRRLKELAAEEQPDLLIVSAHDRVMLEQAGAVS